MKINSNKIFMVLFGLIIVHYPYSSAMEVQKVECDNEEKVAIYFGENDNDPLSISKSEFELFPGLQCNQRDAENNQNSANGPLDDTKKENNIIISGGSKMPYTTEELSTMRLVMKTLLEIHRGGNFAEQKFTGEGLSTFIGIADFLGFDLQGKGIFNQHIDWKNLHEFYVNYKKDQYRTSLPELFMKKCKKARQKHVRADFKELASKHRSDSTFLKMVRSIATIFLNNTLRYTEHTTQLNGTGRCCRRLCLTEDGTMLVALSTTVVPVIIRQLPHVFVRKGNAWEQCENIEKEIEKSDEYLQNIAISGNGKYLVIVHSTGAAGSEFSLRVCEIDRSSATPKIKETIFERKLCEKSLRKDFCRPSLWVDRDGDKIVTRINNTVFTITKKNDVKEDNYKDKGGSSDSYMNFYGSQIAFFSADKAVLEQTHFSILTVKGLKWFRTVNFALNTLDSLSISMGKNTEEFLVVSGFDAQILACDQKKKASQSTEKIGDPEHAYCAGEISNNGRYVVLVDEQWVPGTANCINFYNRNLGNWLNAQVKTTFAMSRISDGFRPVKADLKIDKNFNTVVASWETADDTSNIYSCFIDEDSKKTLEKRTCSVMEYIINSFRTDQGKNNVALLGKVADNRVGDRPINISSIYPGLPTWMQAMVRDHANCRTGWGPSATYKLCKNKNVPWYYKAETVLLYAIGTATAVGTAGFLAYKYARAD